MISNESKLGRQPPYSKNSLNFPLMFELSLQIDDQNSRLVRRLDQAHSLYSKKSMRKSLKKYKQIKANLTNKQKDPFFNFSNRSVDSEPYRRYRPKTADLN